MVWTVSDSRKSSFEPEIPVLESENSLFFLNFPGFFWVEGPEFKAPQGKQIRMGASISDL